MPLEIHTSFSGNVTGHSCKILSTTRVDKASEHASFASWVQSAYAYIIYTYIEDDYIKLVAMVLRIISSCIYVLKRMLWIFYCFFAYIAFEDHLIQKLITLIL